MNATRFLSSTTFRLAIWYVGLFSVSVIVLFAFIYWSTARYMTTQSDAAIETEIQALAERYERAGIPGLRRLIVERVRRQQPTGGTIYLLSDPAYQPIAGNISRWPDGKKDSHWLTFDLEVKGSTSSTVHTARARVFLLRSGFHLLVGRDIETLKLAKARIIRSLAWALVLTLILGVVGGLIISRRMLNRLDQMNQTSQQIMDGDFAQRIPLSGHDDEFDQLARNLNRMLDQIQMLLEDVRRVSDNIAHDMKTPLARLRGRLETLASSDTNDKFASDELNQALKESDQLLTIFNAVLRIARIESGSPNHPTQRVDLMALMNDLAELYEPLAAQKSLDITTYSTQHAVIYVDRDIVFQAFSNLMDNAIKYSPRHTCIEVSVGTDPTPYFQISDKGPGIPETEHEQVFQRFYRLDQSRSTSGNGLGLSLVRAVANRYGANISLTNHQPGLTVRIDFPVATDRPPRTQAAAHTQTPELPAIE